MSQLWKENEGLHNFGFLLVDARNAFNEVNRIALLWNARHLWVKGSRFLFNCYRHHSPLMCRSPDGTTFLLYSQEGVTQGCPTAMVAYGIAVLPLAKELKSVHIDNTISLFADDLSAAGLFESINNFFDDLCRLGPDFGYFPEPTKSNLIVHPHEIQDATVFFNIVNVRGFQITTGSRYLGGFIGDEGSRDAWLTKKLSDWEGNILDISAAAHKFPQSAYAGLQKSLQHEWGFVQRVVPDIGPQFWPLEEAITNSFLPALFGESSFEVTDYRRALTALPVKFSGLSIPDPSESAAVNYERSTLVCSHLSRAVQGKIPFMIADHEATRKEVLAEYRPRQIEENEDKLDSLIKNLPNPGGKNLLARTISRGGKTGQWLTVLPSTVSGTELGCNEFRDALRLRYGRSLANLPSHCDGCGASFSLEHALSCKVGGLIIQRHDEINQELASLSTMALKNSSVRAEPLINPGSADKVNQSPPTQETPAPDTPPEPPEDNRDRGDLLVRNLWKQGSDCIIDVRVTNLDAPSYISRDPASVLASHEKQKKKKYVDDCLQQRRTFSPFVLSSDGMLGFEANNVLKQLARILADKWERPYSAVCGMVKARISIACVRATHLCLRGSRIPVSTMSRRIQWGDGAGMGLFKIDRS